MEIAILLTYEEALDVCLKRADSYEKYLKAITSYKVIDYEHASILTKEEYLRKRIEYALKGK